MHTPRPRLPTKPHCSHSPLSLSLCSQLDAIFGGGVESGSITEFYGEYRTGKTQLCLTLCVSSFLPRALGGGEGKALFLDTEGTFRPERLAPIAARYELDEDFVMENVMHARVLNCDHLDELLRDAAGLLADEEAGPFRVLIIDSIIALYRQVTKRGRIAHTASLSHAPLSLSPNRSSPAAGSSPSGSSGWARSSQR